MRNMNAKYRVITFFITYNVIARGDKIPLQLVSPQKGACWRVGRPHWRGTGSRVRVSDAIQPPGLERGGSLRHWRG